MPLHKGLDNKRNVKQCQNQKTLSQTEFWHIW